MEKHPWLAYKNWAVVGASQNPSRYGNKIVHRLNESGFNVIPATPNYDKIDDIKAYPSLLEVDSEIDVVVFVVNPRIGIHVLDEVIEKGIKRIWLQPGTVNKAILQKAEEQGIEVIEACILVVLSY